MSEPEKPADEIVIAPESVEACLQAANLAQFEGREFDAQLHLLRMKFIAAGHP